jgi:hypothetical protein
MEAAAKDGSLKGTETFLFTDNSTAERAFFNGSSKSRILFGLVVRLRRLELEQGMKLHVIHVAGTRMIAQGSDGISRGDLTEGVMTGDSMFDYIPLHLGAIQRSQKVLEWIHSWTHGEGDLLSPEDWYFRGQNITGGERNCDNIWMPHYEAGVHVWAPAPAAGRVAVEQLRRSRHSHTNASHVFVIPRLMGYEWNRQLLRESDFTFELPAGVLPCWPKEMHEPLVVSLCLPFISKSPWKLRGTPKLLGMERKMRRVLLQARGNPGPLLRELWKLPRALGTMSSGLVSRVLYCQRVIPVSNRPTTNH